MKQVVVTRWSPVEGGPRGVTLYGNMGGVDSRFGVDRVEGVVIPWPLAGTFRNFRVDADNAPGGNTWVFTLYKNDAATTLTNSLTGVTKSATDTLHEIAIAPGDEIAFRMDVTDTATSFSFSWEFESQTTKDSAYGGRLGDFGSGSELGAGAFGNTQGSVAAIGGSIAGCDGIITGLRVRAMTAPGVGENYTLAVYVDSVIQNGSGGTVDTRLIVTGATVSPNSNSFSLPITAGKLISVGVTKSAGAPSSFNHLAFGIIFSATTPGQFHTCGTRNDSTNANPLYFWGGQSSGTESLVPGYVGPSGLILTGMRIYGPDVNYRLRYNQADLVNQPNLNCVSGIGSDLDPTHLIAYSSGDIIDIKGIGVIGGNSLNWGFLSYISSVPPGGPFSGIYYIHRNKTNDTLYSAITGGTGSSGPITMTSVVPIPNPYLIL